MSVMVMCPPVALNCSKSWAWSATSRSNFSVPSAVVNSHSPKASPMMTSSVSAPLSSSIFKKAMNSSSKSRIFSCSSPPMCRSLTKKYSSGISGPLLLGGRYLASLVRCPYRGRPFRGRMVDRRVQLGARQHDRCREVEVDEQPHGRPEAPVGHDEAEEDKWALSRSAARVGGEDVYFILRARLPQLLAGRESLCP